MRQAGQIGVAQALHITAGMPPLSIGIACVIVLGVGLISGAARTRAKDPPA